MSIPDNVNDFLGGGSTPSAFQKDDPIGTKVDGIILSAKVNQQRDIKTGEPKFWKDGNPMNQLIITLKTETSADDEFDGKRRLFAKGDMLNAIRDAVKAAGAKTLEEGGRLQVARTGQGTPPIVGFNPPWLHKAKYTPPAKSNIAVDDLF